MSFREDMERGNSRAEFVMAAFSERRGDFRYERTSVGEDKQGADFRVNGKTLQVKCDNRSEETGNVFIEMYSVDDDRSKEPGFRWASPNRADFHLRYLPGRDVVAVHGRERLEQLMEKWAQIYPTSKTRRELNSCYQTEGVLVPVDVFLESAKEVVELGEGGPKTNG